MIFASLLGLLGLTESRRIARECDWANRPPSGSGGPPRPRERVAFDRCGLPTELQP